ncbi:hypothetical protein M5K25_017594 [Dendrobium thyrsiflorum]|uniref:Uncharacterized protein n=1 Tax=Dendrobium thyrsiflorum TaxID=117978 RepID=A0ABD0UMQ2_DENTH
MVVGSRASLEECSGNGRQVGGETGLGTRNFTLRDGGRGEALMEFLVNLVPATTACRDLWEMIHSRTSIWDEMREDNMLQFDEQEMKT